MKNLFIATALFSLASIGLGSVSQAQEPTESQQNLKAFPAAKDGLKRFVIHLPTREDEMDVKVEILAGKTMNIDCNRHWFIGDLKTGTAEGWGFDYFTLEASGDAAATNMGCAPNSGREAFVQVQGQNFIQRYNSRLPLVIYAPEGFEIRYRLWEASKDVSTAKEG